MPMTSKIPSGIHDLACLSTLTTVHHSFTLHSRGNLLSADCNTPLTIPASDSNVTFDSTFFTAFVVFVSTVFLTPRGVDGADGRNTLGTFTDSGNVAIVVSASVTAPSDASESNTERGDGFRIGWRRSGVVGVLGVRGREEGGGAGRSGGACLPRRSKH